MVMVHHHIKYKEIHGVDEIVMMEIGEHRKLHNRLRKENKCNILPSVLKKISWAAYSRTYRKDHREEKNAYLRVYQKNHREDHIVKMRVYHFRNKISKLRPDIIAAVL